MGASTTTIVSADLIGYGDDFFNDEYYLRVIHNDNSVGNAPEHESRFITDYATATGTFTCEAFSANVEANDEITIIPKWNIKDYTMTELQAQVTGGTEDVYIEQLDYKGCGILHMIVAGAGGGNLAGLRVTVDGTAELFKLTAGQTANWLRSVSTASGFFNEDLTDPDNAQTQLEFPFTNNLKIEVYGTGGNGITYKVFYSIPK